MSRIERPSSDEFPAFEARETLTPHESVSGAWSKLHESRALVEGARTDYEDWFFKSGGALDQLCVMLQNSALREKPDTDLLYVVLGGSIEPAVLIALLLRPRRLVFLHDNEAVAESTAKRAAEQIKHVVHVALPRWCTERHLNPDGFKWDPDVALLGCGASSVPGSFATIEKDWLERGEPASTKVGTTGGKNPFVMAAFDFAAVHGVPIWYEDFDEYDPAYGMPNPLTMRFRELSTPAFVFRRHDLERAFAAFDDGRFGEAERRMLEIEQRPERLDRQHIERASQYAKFVKHWDTRSSFSGAVADAPPEAANIAEPLSAIHQMWQGISGNKLIAKSLVGAWDDNGRRFRCGLGWYFASELYACWRIAYIHEQVEEAFLRLCACMEYLIRVQVIVDVFRPDRPVNLQRYDRQTSSHQTLENPKLDQVAEAITGEGFGLSPGARCVTGGAFPQPRSPQYDGAGRAQVQPQHWRRRFKRFADNYGGARNDLIHGFGTVTRERFAEALDSVRETVLTVADSAAGAFECTEPFDTLHEPFATTWEDLRRRDWAQPFVPKPVREVFRG